MLSFYVYQKLYRLARLRDTSNLSNRRHYSLIGYALQWTSFGRLSRRAASKQ